MASNNKTTEPTVIQKPRILFLWILKKLKKKKDQKLKIKGLCLVSAELLPGKNAIIHNFFIY